MFKAPMLTSTYHNFAPEALLKNEETIKANDNQLLLKFALGCSSFYPILEIYCLWGGLEDT
jgi:hypothetical protein